MKTSLFFLLNFLIVAKTFAGFTKGNGGNVLVCTDRENIVLDFYETTEYHGLNFAKELKDTTIFFQLIEKRLAHLDPVLNDKFKNEFSEFNDRLHFVASADLGEINDHHVVLIPKNCSLKQAAIQRYPRVLISSPIFNSLSDTQKNILILHEVVYSIFLRKSALKDSTPVRALVSLIISNGLYDLKRSDLKAFFIRNNISY